MKYTILNTIDSYSDEAKLLLESIGTVTYKSDLSQEAFEALAPDYEVLIVRIGLDIRKPLIDRASKLKAIATATTGLDHIDLAVAEAKKIAVLSLRGETEFLNTITGTAELAFGLLLDLARLTPWAFEGVKRYEWHLEEFKGHNLAHKTLGVFGLGRLGRMVARYGVAFGMRVLYCDPFVSTKDDPAYASYEKVDFGTLVSESDALSIHVHLKDDTDNLFTEDVLAKMKPTAWLINTSRGRIVNQEALIAALQGGRLAGYATDVLEGETDFIRHFADHPLVEYARSHRNCIIVPHTGGLTYESRRDTDVFITEKLKRFLAA